MAILAAALVAAVLTAAALGAAGTKSDGLPVIDVTMDGSSITVSGDLESGAVNVHATATGKNSGSPLFVRLSPGVTADRFLAFLTSKKAQDPNNVEPFGSIVFDAVTGPGTHDVQTILQPGNYVAVDGSGDNPSKFPHTTFTIVPNESPAKLPAAQEWQKSVEFKFRGPGTLHSGQVIRASNAGFVVHMLAAIGAKSEADGRRIVTALRAGNDRAVGKFATHDFFMLFGPTSHGAVQQQVFDVKPGWYVEACFMDTQDGREHTTLGMERLVHIVK